MAYVNKTQTRTSRLVIGSVFNEQGDDSSFRVLVYNYKNTPIQSASILLKAQIPLLCLREMRKEYRLVWNEVRPIVVTMQCSGES